MLTGKKDFVLFKVLDGRVHGRLGPCKLCGGRLKFIENDFDHIHCHGTFDETSQVRIPCDFKAPRTDTALRLQPFYTVKPSEEEVEQMKEQYDSGSPSKELTSELGQDLIDAVKDRKWELDDQEGMKQAATEIMDIVEGKLDLPEGRDNLRSIGQLVLSHNDETPTAIMQAIIKKFGFKEVKEEIEEKKKQAAEEDSANPKNAALILAFSELAELYFKSKKSIVHPHAPFRSLS